MKKIGKNKGITLIALVVTIIVLMIISGIAVATLMGENGIIKRATDAKQATERAEAKEQAQLDILDWVTDRTAKNQDASLDDEKVKGILTGKSYVKEAGDTSFTTTKGEYVIPYSELYKSKETTPTDQIPTSKADLNKLNQALKNKNILNLEDSEFNISLNENEKLIFIKGLPDGAAYEYNNNYYKLKLIDADEDNIIIDSVSELTLVDKIIALGELIDGDDNNAVFRYDNKIYTLYFNHDGEIEIINTQDDTQLSSLKIIVNSGENGVVGLPVNENAGCEIDWGDGKTNQTNQTGKTGIRIASINEFRIAANSVMAYEHTYEEKNKEYTVTISGSLEELSVYYDNVTKEKIIEIAQWGSTGLRSINLGNCTNLRKIAFASYNGSFKDITSFDSAFYGCTKLRGTVPTLWNKSEITGSQCFYGCTLVDNYDDIPDSWK